MRFVVYYHEDHTIDEVMYDDILNVESIDFREYPRVSIMREELYSEATILQAIPENGFDSRDLLKKLKDLVREKNASLATLTKCCPIIQPQKRARIPPLNVSEFS